jgi:hypothetical protein
MSTKFYSVTFLYSLSIFFSFSCGKKEFLTIEQKIEFYQSRAKTYRALANAQRLSPPYSDNKLSIKSKLTNQPMRMIYLKEAKKYQELAEIAKIKDK